MLGSLVVLAACGTSSITEETTIVDSTAVCVDSTMVVDTTAVCVDSTAVDTTKN